MASNCHLYKGEKINKTCDVIDLWWQVLDSVQKNFSKCPSSILRNVVDRDASRIFVGMGGFLECGVKVLTIPMPAGSALAYTSLVLNCGVV